MIAILVRVCVGPCQFLCRSWELFVGESGGSSLKETSWTISASVLALKVPVLLMTIGIIRTSAFMVPWVCRACLSGS